MDGCAARVVGFDNRPAELRPAFANDGAMHDELWAPDRMPGRRLRAFKEQRRVRMSCAEDNRLET